MSLAQIRNTRSLQAKERRPKVAELYLQGFSQNRIAERLGISQPTVVRDLKIIQQAWAEAAIFDFNEAVGRELARIDNLEMVYWEAWFNSQQDAVTRIAKKSDAKGQESTIKNAAQVGDKKYLDGVQWCIEQRVKIMGLAAPEKIALSWQEKLPEEYKDRPSEVQRQFAQMLINAASTIQESGGDDGE